MIDALKIFYALLGVTLLVPVIGGLYVRRAGSAEALVSMAAGIATLLVVRFAVVASVRVGRPHRRGPRRRGDRVRAHAARPRWNPSASQDARSSAWSSESS